MKTATEDAVKTAVIEVAEDFKKLHSGDEGGDSSADEVVDEAGAAKKKTHKPHKIITKNLFQTMENRTEML
eukprot:UN29312